MPTTLRFLFLLLFGLLGLQPVAHSYVIINFVSSAEQCTYVPTSSAAESGSARFFEGTTYSSKLLQQMEGGAGEFHSFPESVTAFEDAGSVKTIVGGDGQTYQMLEIPGSYTRGSGNLYDGTFQWRH